MRDLTRTRGSLVQERARLESRVQKVLEEAGIKLSTVRSSVMGLSGRAILDALCAGESDPKLLARRAHRSVHATQEQMVAALTAEVREHHRFLLRELLWLIDAQDRSIKHLEEEIERHLHPFEEQVERCEKIDFRESTCLACVDGGDRNRYAALPGCRAHQFVGRSLSWTQGKRRQTAETDAADKETAMCGQRWCKRLRGCVVRTATWENAIVASKNGEGANEQLSQWVIVFW